MKFHRVALSRRPFFEPLHDYEQNEGLEDYIVRTWGAPFEAQGAAVLRLYKVGRSGTTASTAF